MRYQRTRLGRIGFALAICLLISTPARASEESERLYSRALVDYHAGRYAQALEILNGAVAADPEDASAHFYRGVTHARLRDYANATVDLREALRLDPGMDPGAVELGVALSQTGAYEEAVPLLWRGTRIEGLAPNAWLFLGVAQLRLGDLDEAQTSFERAAELDAKLSVPSQYYRGVIAYQSRRFREAQEHFEAVVAVQPESDMGREAREFLDQLEQGYEKPFRIYGGTRFQYDSNVQLVVGEMNADDVDNFRAGEADGRFTLMAGGAFAPVSTDRVRLQLGYEFFQSLHFDSGIADFFDVQNHRPEVQLSTRLGFFRSGLLLRYDYYAHGRKDFRDFLQQGTAIPWVVFDERGFGRTEIYYRFRLRDFLDGELEERDAYNHATGLRQFVYFGSPDRYVSAGYQFDREDPEDDTFPFPKDPDRFAYDGHEVSFGLGWVLPLEVRSELGYAYRRETYPENSLFVNSLNDGDPQRTLFTDEGRLDKVHRLVVAFRRPLGAYVSLVASYLGTFNGSNDELFDYERHIGSVGIELSF